MNLLKSLSKYTTIVADTGEFELIEKFQPREATTNPSLILKAVSNPSYSYLLKEAKNVANSKYNKIDALLVLFAENILKSIDGRVSIEVDARLSFDKDETIKRANQIIELFETRGGDRKRILIKIAANWEGVQAAKFLEKNDIACNLTLIFSKIQAVACAQAGVSLISPFVGRVTDWYKKHCPSNEANKDYGVESLISIYNYLKKFDYKTEILGASFRSVEQIIRLAGCDLLTISPALLEKLAEEKKEIQPNLTISSAKNSTEEKLPELKESSFRFALNEDPMTTEKLSEGIRNFAKDTKKLETLF